MERETFTSKEVAEILYANTGRFEEHPQLEATFNRWLEYLRSLRYDLFSNHSNFKKVITKLIKNINLPSPLTDIEIISNKKKMEDVFKGVFNVLLFGVDGKSDYWPAEDSKKLLQRFFSDSLDDIKTLVYFVIIHYITTGNDIPPLQVLFEDKSYLLDRLSKIMGRVFPVRLVRLVAIWYYFINYQHLNITTTTLSRYPTELEALKEKLGEITDIFIIGSGPIQPFEVKEYFPRAKIIALDPIFLEGLLQIPLPSREIYVSNADGYKRVRVGPFLEEKEGDYQILSRRNNWKMDSDKSIIFIPGQWTGDGGIYYGFIKERMEEIKPGFSGFDLLIATNVLRHYPHGKRVAMIRSMTSVVRVGGFLWLEGGWVLDRDRNIIGGVFQKTKSGLKPLFFIDKRQQIINPHK